MTAGRPKVGELFRASPPDRSASLAGLLAPAAGPAETAEPRQRRSELRTSEREPKERHRTRKSERVASASPARHSASSSNESSKVVPVVLDVSVLDELRAFAARMDLTYGAVALRAVEANSDALQRHWRHEPRTSPPGSLFSGTTPLKRRAETGTQTQLRISAVDAETLDRLVGEWAAPSRSALVNEAIRRYLRGHGVLRGEDPVEE